MKEVMNKKILASLLVFAMILQIGIGLPVIYADTTATAGAFTVTGGSTDKDYIYENNTLTVKTSTPLTISGTTESDKIEVADGTEANVILNNTNIDVSSKAETSAFAILGNASCNLTIEGINNLKSGIDKAGLQVESRNGKTASVIINGTGSLSTTGRSLGAGIGGGSGGSGGTITINGGVITATGGFSGAGIGGGIIGSGGTITINDGRITATSDKFGAGIGSGDGSSSGGTITVNGGAITATSSDFGAGIGGGFRSNGGTIEINGGRITATSKYGTGIGSGAIGSNGTFSTSPTGHAFIVASSISDESNKANWKGVIFNGTSGEVYGDAIQLTTSAEIPTANTLTIGSGKTLTIAKDVTLTNKGTIVNHGMIRNHGIYNNDGGILDGNAIIKVNTTTTKVSLEPANVTYGEDTAVTVQAAITPTSTATNKGNVDFYLGDESSGIKLNTNPIPVDRDTQTATLKITKDVLVTSGATLIIGDNMITAVYHGTTDLQESSGTGILTVNKASQAAPKLTSTAETISGKADGKISGLTTSMEYSTTKDGTYTVVTNIDMSFAAGTYYVRYKADTNHEASDSIEVTINKGKMLNVTIPTNQEGYTLSVDKTEMNWHDDVTLTYMLKEGYKETAAFAIMLNGKLIRLDNGRYVLSKSEEDITITVGGVEKVYTYGILNGKDSEWTTNKKEGLTFRIDGDFVKFKGIKIDGKTVEPKYYEVKKGSTIITLKPEYLKTLPTGKHKIDVIYTDKEVAVDFMIKATMSISSDTGEKSITVQTGDESNRMSWFIMFLASSAIITLVTTQRVIQRRK